MTSPPRLALLPRPRTAVLRDGARITIRPLVPEDRALIADAFERLSPRSRFLRFHSPMPALPPRTLDALTAVDHDRHVALIALDRGVAVGVARYVRYADDPSTADVGISVVDATQGRGLGRVLLEALREVAAERGVAVLHFDIHPENRVMAHLAKSLGADVAFRDGGLIGLLPVARRSALADAA